VFHQLTEEQIITMVDLMITRVEAALANKDMAIELTPAAKSLLARRGFDPVLGARPLRRTIQREIEDQLSEKILFGEIEGGQIVIVDVEGVNPDAPEGSRSADDKAGSPSAVSRSRPSRCRTPRRWTWRAPATSELTRTSNGPSGKPGGPFRVIAAPRPRAGWGSGAVNGRVRS
jgi:hypothetical protein